MTPSSQAEGCFVYLIKRSDGTIKVGVSRNVAKRRSTLANASPDTLSILKTIETDEVLAFHIESGVKALLRQFRTRGEWFKCSDTLALLALRAAKHGELDCRSRIATEIKRQKLRILDAETVAALTLPEGKQDVVFFDQDLTGLGFRLRRRPDGRLHRSWIIQYLATDGHKRRMKLGNFETLTAAEARTYARQLLAQVALGGDPQAERKTERKTTRERAQRRARLRSLPDDQVMTVHEWCTLNRISVRAGRRILASPDAPRIVQLSARRRGVTVRANRAWQHARELRRT
jgi:hypothetical protein